MGIHMEREALVGILSLTGTLIGSLSGIIASARLTNFRLQKLEQKVDEHNGYGRKIPALEERVKSIDERLGNIEEVVYRG